MKIAKKSIHFWTLGLLAMLGTATNAVAEEAGRTDDSTPLDNQQKLPVNRLIWKGSSDSTFNKPLWSSERRHFPVHNPIWHGSADDPLSVLAVSSEVEVDEAPQSVRKISDATPAPPAEDEGQPLHKAGSWLFGQESSTSTVRSGLPLTAAEPGDHPETSDPGLSQCPPHGFELYRYVRRDSALECCRSHCPRSESCCGLLVNLHPWSRYLDAEMPEGYDLICFMQTSRQYQFYHGPLVSGGVVEPGGTRRETKTVEGDQDRPLAAISVNITPPAGELPKSPATEQFEKVASRTHLPGTVRDWDGIGFQWHASLLNHQPLYFEEVSLERHGYTQGIYQPLLSGGRFFGTVAILPYLTIVRPYHQARYTLGEYRPGSPAPFEWQLPPAP